MVRKNGVDMRLGTRATEATLLEGGFDAVVLATGISPRTPDIPGVEHPKVLSYVDVLRHGVNVGKKVAIIGAGGIGFDVGEFLTHPKSDGVADNVDLDHYLQDWGVDKSLSQTGGLFNEDDSGSKPLKPQREVTLLQRKKGKLGGE